MNIKRFVSIICVLCLNFLLTQPCFAEAVFFNTKTHKYHNFACRYASKCTVNCIKIDKKEAKRRGGIPCKVCGG